MATDSLDTTDSATAPASSGASKKIGPFTPQMWGIVIGGGILAGYLVKKYTGLGSAASSTNTAASGLTSQTNPANAGYTATGGPLAGGGSSSESTGQITTSTNTQWQQVALELLISQGTDPALAQQALGNFIDGQPLTPQQQSIVSLAIRLAGAPPEGAPPIVSAATPSAPDGSSGIAATSTPIANPAQPSVAPGTSSPNATQLTPTQTQWIGDTVTTYGLLNEGGAVATQNFPRAQFLMIRPNDPNLLPLVGIAYNSWLKSVGDPNHLSV